MTTCPAFIETEASEWLHSLQAGDVDLFVTDPPFAAAKSSAASGEQHERAWLSTPRVEHTLRHMAALNPRWLAVFTASSGNGVTRVLQAVNGIMPLARVLSWCKPHTRSRGLPGPAGWQTTLVLLFGRHRSPFRGADHIVCDGMRYRVQGTQGHPAELPDAVAEWMAALLAPDGETMVDPFMGTGKLPIAFARHGVSATGLDFDPGAIEIARRLALRHWPA